MGRASVIGAWREILSTMSVNSTSAPISWRARSERRHHRDSGSPPQISPRLCFRQRQSGIKTPKDLIGKRVGGTNFQPAGNIWIRGILEHYGVPHQSITWVVDRSEDVEFTPPPGLKIEMIPPDKSMDTMLAEGEIPAMINPYIPKPIVSGDDGSTVSRLQTSRA